MKSPRATILASAILFSAIAQAQSAQYTAAQTEMNTLATAMELVYLDTGWLTTLENLDDLPTPDVNDSWNYILDGGGALAISVFTADFAPNRIDLIDRPVGFNGWQGPYVTYQSNRIDLPPVVYDIGSPLDPWGNPYRFYTPLGLVDPVSESITLDGYGDQFDRFMIVSYGPDGIPSELDPPPRSIGVFFMQTQAISSVRISAGAERDPNLTLTVRGYFFGEDPGTLEINGQPVNSVVEWTDTQVTAMIESFPTPESEFAITPDGGNVTSTFTGFIVEGETSAPDWQLY